MIDTKDIAWMAGIIEGEGCIHYSSGSSPTISVVMSDKDVIDKVSFLFGIKTYGPFSQKREGKKYKPQWKAIVFGARAVGWMMTIYSLMGERRRAKIGEVLSEWKQRKSRRPRRFPPDCHPDRKNHARGLCRSCYYKSRRRGFVET